MQRNNTRVLNSYRNPIVLAQVGSHRKSVWVMLVPLALLFSGCDRADFVAVKNFAAVSQAATDQFPDIAADIYGSCVRSAQFEADPGAQPAVGARCDRFKQLTPGLISANKVLEEYLFSLGRLAADQRVTYGPALNGLAGEIQATNTFKPAQINAISGILGFLLNAEAGRFRQQQVEAAIQATNANLKVLIPALKAIIGQDYARLLLIEEQTMDAYYRSKLRAGKQQPLLAALIQNQWQNDKTALTQKKAAAAAYVKILEEIQTGHQQLYDDRNRLTSQETVQAIVQYARTLQPLVKDLVKAF